MDAGPVRLLRILWWVLLVVVALPIWLVQRDVWDGVIGAYGIARSDFSGIRAWLIPSNWGLVYVLLRTLAKLGEFTGVPAWAWIKLLLVASIAGLSCEARLLSRDVLGLPERDCRVAGLLALSFPCWYVLYGSTFVYLVFVWAVFAGHRLLHQGGVTATRVLGLVLVVLSFQVNSNLVMVFSLEAVRWLHRRRDEPWAWRRSVLVGGAAIATYLSLRLVWPPQGIYGGYNNLVWPFSMDGLRAWVRALLMALTWLPLLLAPPAVARMLAGPAAPDAWQKQAGRRQGVAIATLLVGALFAYMAVGKGAPLFVLNVPVEWLGTGSFLGKAAPRALYTTADGWSMRHAFLFSVPAAVAGSWLLRLGSNAGVHRARAWRAGLAAALLLNVGWLVDGHAAKQTRMAQEEAIVRGLRLQRPPPSGSVDIELAPRVGWTVGTYEANYWLWQAYGRSAWAAAAFAPDPADRARADADRARSVASPLPKAYFLMDEAALPGCRSAWSGRLPEGLGPWSVAADRLGLRPIPPVPFLQQPSQCPQR